MKDQLTLILLTQKFPFETGEEFIAGELNRLQEVFDHVVIIPTAVRDFSNPRYTGPKTSVRIVKNPASIKEIAFKFIGRFFQAFIILIAELRKSGWNLKLLKHYIYHIPYALQLKSIFFKEMNYPGEFVLYSYWMDTNAFAASLLKRDNPEVKLVVRSHGGDLYNERHASGSVAFRQSVYAEAESLLFISDHGYNYASIRYPSHLSKMKVFRLGVESYDSFTDSDFPEVFHIVSCSSLVPLKRVNLIAEVLNTCNLPIFWTHFGGENSEIGELQKSLHNLRENLKVNWKGKVDNSDIHSYYASNHIDLLINLSSSEGIPVSMMEAISFGIPLFANAVGGIPEIAGGETGMLLPEGLSLEMLAFHLEQFLISGKTRDLQFREGVKRFYSENYSAKSNYDRLIMHLQKHSFKVHKPL